MTRVGQLAALDQQVRQLESFGAIVVTDETYAELRRWRAVPPCDQRGRHPDRMADTLAGRGRASCSAVGDRAGHPADGRPSRRC